MRWEAAGFLDGRRARVWWEDGTFGSDDEEHDLTFANDVDAVIAGIRLRGGDVSWLRPYHFLRELDTPDAYATDPEWSVIVGLHVLGHGAQVTHRSPDFPEASDSVAPEVPR